MTHVYFPAVAPPLAEAISGLKIEVNTAAVVAAMNSRLPSTEPDSDVANKLVCWLCLFWTNEGGVTNAEALVPKVNNKNAALDFILIALSNYQSSWIQDT